MCIFLLHFWPSLFYLIFCQYWDIGIILFFCQYWDIGIILFFCQYFLAIFCVHIYITWLFYMYCMYICFLDGQSCSVQGSYISFISCIFLLKQKLSPFLFIKIFIHYFLLLFFNLKFKSPCKLFFTKFYPSFICNGLYNLLKL